MIHCGGKNHRKIKKSFWSSIQDDFYNGIILVFTSEITQMIYI